MATLLEKIVDERVGQTLVGTVSVAVDRIAEEIAREALGDETFSNKCRSPALLAIKSPPPGRWASAYTVEAARSMMTG